MTGKKQPSQRYCVVQYDDTGRFVAVLSGMGRHRGTWDYGYAKSTAQRHAAVLRKRFPLNRFKVEPVS